MFALRFMDTLASANLLLLRMLDSFSTTFEPWTDTGPYRLKISRHPDYTAVQKLLAERPDAILLDIGCCCGSIFSIGADMDLSIRRPIFSWQ